MIAVIAASVAACATLPPTGRSRRDPFERFNRTVFRMNTALDHAILRPLARRSRRVPGPVMTAISNFVSNLFYPLTIVNDLLQGNLHAAGNDVGRLALNTTLGIGGLFDPATGLHLDRHCEDFGITLGKWGVPSGPFLMLPFLGPSSVRDAIGMVPQAYVYLVVPGPALGVPLYGADLLETRAALLPADRVVENAYDPYALERSVYLQRRDFRVHGAGEDPALTTDAPSHPQDPRDRSDPCLAAPAPPASTDACGRRACNGGSPGKSGRGSHEHRRHLQTQGDHHR